MDHDIRELVMNRIGMRMNNLREEGVNHAIT